MAEFPAMPLWTDAYLADTTHLSTFEHGAYLLLLMAMWRTKEKALPNDDAMLARYARITRGQWSKIRPTIMAFFTVEGGVIRQGRLSDEAEAVKTKSRKQSDKAKARWLKNNETGDAVAEPQQSRGDAGAMPPLPLPINKIPDPKGSGEYALSFRDMIFGDGLRWLASHTGKRPDQLRSMLGRWCKDHGDEMVMATLAQAQRDTPVEAVSWIQRKLNGKRPDDNLRAFAADLREGAAG